MAFVPNDFAPILPKLNVLERARRRLLRSGVVVQPRSNGVAARRRKPLQRFQRVTRWSHLRSAWAMFE
ncbi:hypothetical protein M885DRAFT_514911 [Pelagophyceae sp. CCMP2097]|nr:hypothetical protein M885DRAFT_514911 [Pelagophyceae sp. CCMP2097]